MTLEYLQNYWWLLVSVLGGILVFLLFVQGGQSMLLTAGSKLRRDLIVNSMGSKWELTFTTLVTFGGAAFASFPLFYSTSFGGAYWLWILILFSFVVQAVSYEFRRKKGNLYGTRTYDIFLFLNGCVGCILLGVAVSMFFFGAEFTVNKGNLLIGSAPVISQWAPTHGFEAIFNWKNLILGIAVLFLARTQACLYMMNNITDDPDFFQSLKGKAFINGGIFLVFFLWFLGTLLTADGYTVISEGIRTKSVEITPFKYYHNYMALWPALACLTIGVVAVLFGWLKSCFGKHFTKGIWFTGIGTFLVVASLFWVAGYNDTPFYPSLLNPADSLTIRNASSSEFTLTAMSYVSILIPFVLAYIAYVWRSMDKKKLTPEGLESSDHAY
ncbi:MAG: cytochrome d ubiquinol oxidase subunit II [Bacteroides sp.]|nr:cytochrome d ubiquinol oxidase subunit II [Bacteroidales bacterium]MBD5341082.1 cytochrome d ubiquinol oxidase subunit II [Bacteroides sp.]